MLKDLNYFPLDVESNIYGLTTLEFEDKTNKVLVATLDCRIYCINYNRFKPQTKEVEFTYIPNGAKIISIGALKRGPNDFVVGITHSLSPNDGTTKSSATRDIISSDNHRQTTYYFNIYASESVLPSFDLDYVAQGCQTIRLRYVPYHLYSTEYIIATAVAANNSNLSDDTQLTTTISRKPFWLLSGGDNCLHAYFEDKPYQSFEEVPIDECLPELENKQGIALWIDVANIDRTEALSSASASSSSSSKTCIIFERAVVLGFEDGSVRLYHSVMTKQSRKFELVRASCFDSYTTIIPCVKLFTINSIDTTNSKFRRRLKEKLKTKNQLESSQDKSDKQLEESLSLLIISSTNACLLFEDVLKNGLDIRHELPDSQRLDCATTAIVGDANADGYNELLIGTHGKELLTYQYYPCERKYKLQHINVTNYPIFSLSILDLTGDASKDVVILLTNGILVIQSSTVKDMIETCRRRLGAILSALDDK